MMTHRLAASSNWAFVQILLLCLVTCTGCNSSKTESKTSASAETARIPAPTYPRPEAPPEDYVGSKACAECHQEISHDYHQSHPMAKSLGKVLEVEQIEDYTENPEFSIAKAPRSPIITSYKLEKKPGKVFHHERANRDDGELVYDFEVPVAYSVGSGERGRSYLINYDGILLMSPVTWYSSSQQWDLSPGYKHGNMRFTRRIVDGCVGCHAGRVDAVEDSSDRFQAVPFLEESIGCERCHGPGERHISYHREMEKSGKDPIVNPQDLSPRLRDAVCLQCHLIGEHRLTRYGRTDFDFRPGDDITDIWTVFLKKADEEEYTQAVSQAEQMLESRCYQESQGKLGCISCHDPHKTPAKTEVVSQYRQACLTCHSPGHTECAQPVAERIQVTAEDSCIVCHMPKTAADDVPHTSPTDHRVLRKYETKRKPIGSRQSQSLTVYGIEDDAFPEEELRRAQGISLVRAAEQHGQQVLAVEAVPLLRSWLRSAPDDIEALHSLGTAYWLLKDYRLAAQSWETGLKRFPKEEKFLRRLMMLSHENQMWQDSVKYGRQLVKVNPWDFEYWGRLAHSLGQLQEYRESAQAAKRALELNPAETRLYQWLAEVYSQLGDQEQSQHYLKLYQQLTQP